MAIMDSMAIIMGIMGITMRRSIRAAVAVAAAPRLVSSSPLALGSARSVCL